MGRKAKKQHDPNFVGTVRAVLIERPLSVGESYGRSEQRKGKTLEEILSMIHREKPIMLRRFCFFPAEGVRFWRGYMAQEELDLWIKAENFRAAQELDNYGYEVIRLYRGEGENGG